VKGIWKLKRDKKCKRGKKAKSVQRKKKIARMSFSGDGGYGFGPI
jgi:hypothetical protein